MLSTHRDNGALMEGSKKLGPMMYFFIFAGLEKLVNLLTVEDARFDSDDSRFSLNIKFFHPPV
jgi:hypothetical protein